jgi:hypothetical protein
MDMVYQQDAIDNILDDLSALVGPAKYSAWAALSGEERLNALLGDTWWGD